MTARLRTLRMRLIAQREELATCTTDAMRKCVEEAIADTRRQLGKHEAEKGATR